MSDSSSSDIEMLLELSDFDPEDDDDDYEPRNKIYKTRVNHMAELNDYEFVYRFRLSKSAVSNLLKEITPFLKVTSKRNHGISPLHQLLLTLRFYAVGTVLVSVAQFVGVSKSSAARIVSDVSSVIARVYPKYIYVHENTQQGFDLIAGLPRVMGAIDNTHILIQTPNSNIGTELKNKKSPFSLKVQCVCDAELRFMNVVARWSGSTHDATIFNNSKLKAECESGLYQNRWLIGGNAYPCQSYLLTPLINPTSASELRYNEAHSRTLNTIDKCIRVWKKRFPVLSSKIRLSLANAQAIIIATSVLHNICRLLNLEDMEPEIEIPDCNIEFPNYLAEGGDVVNNFSERQALIDNHFTRLEGGI